MASAHKRGKSAARQIHWFQHVAFEGLGSIEEWIRERGHTLSTTRFFEASPAWPALSQSDWLIVMGGPMNVDEESTYPWLAREKQFIAQAVRSGKVVLGICLGAQLIASALGAAVVPNPFKEIGWLPVRLSPQIRRHPLVEGFPEQWITFHWHGDTFDLPPGALHLGESAGCRNQGFVLGDRVAGLQFHLEMTPGGVRSILESCSAELIEGPYIQGGDRIMDPDAPYGPNRHLLWTLLDRLDAARA